MSLIRCEMDKFLKEFEKDNQRRVKASRDALKVEAWRLRIWLRSDIRSGISGNKRFSPLSIIGRFFSKHKDRPLYKLALPVRYDVVGRDPFHIEIGFTGKVSASWKRIAERQQEGQGVSVTEGVRRFWMLTGAQLKKKKRTEAKFFFLKPSTMNLKIPKREIIDPFWDAHKGDVMRNIKEHYERKLRGERI